MDAKQHKNLIQFVDKVKADHNLRAEFLSDPLKTLAPMIGAQKAPAVELSLSNQVLLETMRNPKLLDELRNYSLQHDAKKIDDAKLAQLTASSLSQHLPDDLKNRLNNAGKYNPGIAAPIANLLVAVDTVVVVTEAAVVNSETFFNGMPEHSFDKIKDFANVLAKGQ